MVVRLFFLTLTGRKECMRLLWMKICCFFMPLIFSGCFFTKVVTTPVRVGGAVTSVVPVVGNATDKALDSVADGVDKIPI